jgi:hypothetical protein
MRGLSLCLALMLALAVTGAGLVNAEDGCLDPESGQQAIEAMTGHDGEAAPGQHAMAMAMADHHQGEAASGHSHEEGGQHALFHACCVHGGFSGLLALEPKAMARARLASAFPRRPDMSRESRALAPEPAPPRAISA